MRQFHSYGPVDCEDHFCVPRTELIAQCLQRIIDDPEKGGHFFTIYAPRQAGKTWLMRRVKAELEARHDRRFHIATMSMQGLIFEPEDGGDAFLPKTPCST